MTEHRAGTRFSLRTALWTLVIYTAVLALLGLARGSAETPGFGQRVALAALSGFMVGFFLHPVVCALTGSFWRRFGLVALMIFALASISNALETVLYLPAVAIAGTIVGGIIQAAVLAAVLAATARPMGVPEAQSPHGRPRWVGTLAFIAALAVIWLPIYFLFVTLDTPVVHWLQHGNGDVFAHPPLAPMLAVELGRGVVHAAVLLGVGFLARGRRSIVWLWGALVIAILNGWLPILPVSTLPFGIRVANGMEITLSSIVFAGVAAYVFPVLCKTHGRHHPHNEPGTPAPSVGA